MRPRSRPRAGRSRSAKVAGRVNRGRWPRAKAGSRAPRRARTRRRSATAPRCSGPLGHSTAATCSANPSLAEPREASLLIPFLCTCRWPPQPRPPDGTPGCATAAPAPQRPSRRRCWPCPCRAARPACALTPPPTHRSRRGRGLRPRSAERGRTRGDPPTRRAPQLPVSMPPMVRQTEIPGRLPARCGVRQPRRQRQHRT
mmetsp:Transcript_32049/g.82521  ORF Transcript_32049/g.82521 Transcript_32049/m.82521 type:complete len:200 (-) Transcript_32049:77-676(-)